MAHPWWVYAFTPAWTAWFVACAAPSGSAPTVEQATAITVCAAGTTVQGIDVSTWDGPVNWTMAAANGVRFAYIRVSDGLDYPDDQFAANWTNARAAGVLRGAYQYFRPNQDPIAQADYLLAHMGTLQPGDLPPVIDIEVSGGLTQAQVTASIHQWVDHVQAATGRAPIFYVGLYSWPSLSASNDFAAYRLWIPQYGPTCPDLPSPWTNWTIFQNSDSGNIPGVGTMLDMNQFNGTYTDLLAMAAERTVCGDGVCGPGETIASCPADCPACANVPANGRIVDEGEACFEPGGDPTYLRHVNTVGWEGALLWTHATSAATPSNYGIWHLTFDQTGQYRVEAYTAAPWAQSTRARYLVQHQGATDMATIDQSATDGWSRIGEFQFAAGGNQSVRLNDDTGEPASTNVQLVFDALRITRLDGVAPADGGVAPVDGGVVANDAGGAVTDATREGDGGEGDGSATPSGSSHGGCTTSPGGHRSTVVRGLAMGLVALAFRRRRRAVHAGLRSVA